MSSRATGAYLSCAHNKRNSAASSLQSMVLDTGREGRNRLNHLSVFFFFKHADNWIGGTASVTRATAATAWRFTLFECFEFNVSTAAG